MIASRYECPLIIVIRDDEKCFCRLFSIRNSCPLPTRSSGLIMKILLEDAISAFSRATTSHGVILRLSAQWWVFHPFQPTCQVCFACCKNSVSCWKRCFQRFRLLHGWSHRRPDELRYLHRRPALHLSGRLHQSTGAVHVRFYSLEPAPAHHPAQPNRTSLRSAWLAKPDSCKFGIVFHFDSPKLNRFYAVLSQSSSNGVA